MKTRGILATSIGILAIAACVGSDPAPASGGTSSTSSSGGTTDSGIPVTDSGCGDACAVQCEGTKIACGTVCVDPIADPNNCARCDRKCGMGSTCAASRCSPATVVEVPSALHRIVIAGSNIYFSTPTDIQRVSKNGGTATAFHRNPDTTEPYSVIDRTLSVSGQSVYWAGEALMDFGLGDQMVPGIFSQAFAANTYIYTATYELGSGLAASDGTLLAWSAESNAAIYACTPPCPAATGAATLKWQSSTDIQSVVVVGGKIAWTQAFEPGNGKLWVTGAKNGAVAIATSHRPDHLVAHGDSFYWVDWGSDDATTKPGIFKCAQQGCQDSPTKLVEWSARPSELAVDDSGVYFTVRGEAANATGEVVVCRDLDKGCNNTATAPEVLLNGLERPKSIAVDSTHVFVTTHAADGLTAKILRVAK